MAGKTGKNKTILMVQQDFEKLSHYKQFLGFLLYGSWVRGEQSPRSDIDICIVAPDQDLVEAYEIVIEHLDRDPDPYDIRFFEELPLYMQGQVIEDGEVVFSPDEGELYEYFYPFRKEWNDQKNRLARVNSV